MMVVQPFLLGHAAVRQYSGNTQAVLQLNDGSLPYWRSVTYDTGWITPRKMFMVTRYEPVSKTLQKPTWFRRFNASAYGISTLLSVADPGGPHRRIWNSVTFKVPSHITVIWWWKGNCGHISWLRTMLSPVIFGASVILSSLLPGGKWQPEELFIVVDFVIMVVLGICHSR